ncbi:hypothetical protein [Streptomyces rhizosphaericus]|uniref:hypothetical protein n=1 Tax=Streptomyces rhizosphaericus TaxID=114699 RepID=UPI001FEAE079|nr:hypothetical protein [Streptomyces indonesiensis]
MLRLWTCRNSPARMDGGGMRADAEVVLNEAGRAVLAELCGVEPAVLARALPAFTVDDPKISKGREAGLAQGRWQAASAVAGEAAFACRSCTARRTGQALRAVRYVPRRQRVCGRHGRWLLDADADQPLEHLDLRGVPEVVAAQRRWTGVARRAVRAAADPGEVFALAHAVVARWWEEALHWHQEEIWPQRLHRVAGGNAGTDLKRWRIVGRDAVVFPRWWPWPTLCWIRPWPSWCGGTAVPGGRGRCPLTGRSAAGWASGWDATGWGRCRQWTTAGLYSPGWALSSAGGAVKAGRPGGGTIRGGCGANSSPPPWPEACAS